MRKEIKARFLDIDKASVVAKLKSIKAEDKGEVTLTEIIFYDRENKWPDEGRFVRIRSHNGVTKLTYKHNKAQTIDSAHEIEFAVPDEEAAPAFCQ
jgi:adenylate cyclase class IV